MFDDSHPDFGFVLSPTGDDTGSSAAGNASVGGTASLVVPSGVDIESTGSTALVQVGNNYFVHPVGDQNGVELSAFGAPVFAGQFGAFVPIAAEAVASGYQVAWGNGANQFTVLNADNAGVFQSHAFFVVYGGNYALQSLDKA